MIALSEIGFKVLFSVFFGKKGCLVLFFSHNGVQFSNENVGFEVSNFENFMMQFEYKIKLENTFCIQCLATTYIIMFII